MHTFQNISKDTFNKSNLNGQEVWALEHQGHEAMHAEMVFIIIIVMVFAQLFLVLWRKHHFHSFQLATTIGMWIIPILLSIYRFYYRFILIHLFYSFITLYMIRRCLQIPIKKNTPRLVYSWFYMVFKISHGLGLIGYTGLIFWFFGLNIILFLPITLIYYFVLALFYGLYFGVLNRDISEICSDYISQTYIGLKSKYNNDNEDVIDKNLCSICGERIFQLILHTPEQEAIEKTFRLDCGHVFHEFCIRGWCIVGKKQTCPQCKEKVELQTLFPNPWERLHVMHSKLLDWVRYLIAWQPLITLLIEAINHALNLK